MILEVVVTVECDECGDEATFSLLTMSDKELSGLLADEEWVEGRTPHGKQMLCPDCSELVT